MSADAVATTLRLLATRAEDATLCPSEVARALAPASGDDWRPHMATVHAAVDALAADKAISLSWKGAAMLVRAGPYRIGHRRRS